MGLGEGNGPHALCANASLLVACALPMSCPAPIGFLPHAQEVMDLVREKALFLLVPKASFPIGCSNRIPSQ